MLIDRNDVNSADARMLILRGLGVPPEAPDSHDKLRFLLPPLRERVKAKTKEIMIDDELRRRRGNKMQMIAEGAEAQRVEKAQEERKRKMEDKAAWEGEYLALCRCYLSMQGSMFKLMHYDHAFPQTRAKPESQTGEAFKRAVKRQRGQRCLAETMPFPLPLPFLG